MLRLVIRYLGKVLLTLLRWCAAPFLPTDPKLALFGSGLREFSDNSKYLFLYVHSCATTHKTVWVVRARKDIEGIRARGFDAVWRWSPRTFVLVLRASHLFVTHGVDDIYPIVSPRSIVVNLWHGSPIKRMGYDSVPDRKRIELRRRIGLKPVFHEWTYLIVAHPLFIDAFVSATGLPRECFLPLGLPRNDILMTSAQDPKQAERIREEVLQELGIRHGQLFVLVAPTFRYDGSLLSLYADIFTDEFAAELERRGVCLLVRFHALERTQDDGRSTTTPSFVDVSSYPDVQRLLIAVDGLVTDYSSIVFDHSILGRPSVLYQPDRERYEASVGGFYFEPAELSFDLVQRSDELRAWLLSLEERKRTFRAIGRDRFNVDGPASPRLVDRFLGVA